MLAGWILVQHRYRQVTAAIRLLTYKNGAHDTLVRGWAFPFSQEMYVYYVVNNFFVPPTQTFSVMRDGTLPPAILSVIAA